MLIKEFINRTFERISNAFPQALLQYQFDNRVSTHYIKVSPPYIYEGNSFTDIFWELDDLFMEHFPEETLCFLTDESLIRLNNPSRTHLPFWAKKSDDSTILYQQILTLKQESDQSGRIQLSSEKLMLPVLTITLTKLATEDQASGSYQYAMAA